MIVILRSDHAKITADAAHRMIVGVHAHAAPDYRFGREALLHAGRERQILLDFLLALFELRVRVAKLRFGVLLFGNVDEGNDRKLPAVGIFKMPAR